MNAINFSKIAGWGLLIAGIVLIVWTLFSSYNIFIGKSELPEFFFSPVKSYEEKGSEIQDIQMQLEKMIGEQLKGILPAGSIVQLLNLIVWSMLAFILIFGGTQLAILGIKLIKK